MAKKRVNLYDAKTDELIKEFESVKDCAAYLGIDSAPISNNINGKRKTICRRKYYCKPVDTPYYKPIQERFCTHTPKPVDVYKDDMLIGTYDNANIAANAVGIAPYSIHRSCRGDSKKALNGYTFKYNLERWQENKRVPVDLYDVETNELFKSFDDIKECADFLGLSTQTIRQNLRGDIKTVKVRSFYCKSKIYE